jgi:glycerol-3-phosphate cytidylyltransferase
MSNDKEDNVTMTAVSPYNEPPETMGDSVGSNIEVSLSIDTDDVYKDADQTKIGFTCGAFDLLHAGHTLMLQEARQQCDHLIVAVQTDPTIDRPKKNRPVQSYEERLTMVRAIRWVDEVCQYDTEEELYSILQEINPDIRIVGVDWKDKEYTGHDLDIEVYFNSRDHDWSTSDLRKRVHLAEEKKIGFNRRSMAVNNSTAHLDMLDRFPNLRNNQESDGAKD